MRKLKDIKLPTEVTIGARKFNIIIDNEAMDNREAFGTIDVSTNIIKLATEADGKKRPIDAIEATLWHEIIHAVLYSAGHGDLSNDESFVSRISTLIHQANKTLK